MNSNSPAIYNLLLQLFVNPVKELINDNTLTCFLKRMLYINNICKSVSIDVCIILKTCFITSLIDVIVHSVGLKYYPNVGEAILTQLGWQNCKLYCVSFCPMLQCKLLRVSIYCIAWKQSILAQLG